MDHPLGKSNRITLPSRIVPSLLRTAVQHIAHVSMAFTESTNPVTPAGQCSRTHSAPVSHARDWQGAVQAPGKAR